MSSLSLVDKSGTSCVGLSCSGPLFESPFTISAPVLRMRYTTTRPNHICKTELVLETAFSSMMPLSKGVWSRQKRNLGEADDTFLHVQLQWLGDSGPQGAHCFDLLHLLL